MNINLKKIFTLFFVMIAMIFTTGFANVAIAADVTPPVIESHENIITTANALGGATITYTPLQLQMMLTLLEWQLVCQHQEAFFP